MKTAVSVLILACITALSCARKESGFMAETVDGVRIVHNFGVRSGRTVRSIEFSEDLSIGGDNEGGSHLLNSPVDIDSDPSGNIYILDFKDASIKRFNPGGAIIDTIGRKGQGPGEFENPVSLEVVPTGIIIVADPSRSAVTIMALNGNVIKSVRIGEYLSDLISGRDGVVVTGWTDFGESKDFAGILNIESGRVSPLFSQACYWPKRVQDNEMTYDFPYSLRFALDSKNRLFVGSGTAYEISVLDVSGQLLFKFKKDHDRIPLQGEMLKRVSGITLRGPNPYMTKPFYPVFDSMAVDERGRVWIEHYQPKWADRPNPETPYDVFSPDGIFLFETKIAGQVASRLIFKNGYIYALKKIERGYINAVRLKIRE
jgi:hypothetical protein